MLYVLWMYLLKESVMMRTLVMMDNLNWMAWLYKLEGEGQKRCSSEFLMILMKMFARRICFTCRCFPDSQCLLLVMYTHTHRVHVAWLACAPERVCVCVCVAPIISLWWLPLTQSSDSSFHLSSSPHHWPLWKVLLWSIIQLWPLEKLCACDGRIACKWECPATQHLLFRCEPRTNMNCCPC